MLNRKLCYVVVVDEEPGGVSQSNASFWYTKSVLQSVLQLVGCKVHHALKISRRVFDILDSESLEVSCDPKLISLANRDPLCDMEQRYSEGIERPRKQDFESAESKCSAETNSKAFDYYKKQVSITVKRVRFLDAICSSLEEYHYVGPSQRDDIILACRLRERKESITILLCGTSGCGKSTLSSLLASRLGITTVVSTDSIRHMMRSFIDEKSNPLLWASTYHAGEFLDPVAVAQAKVRKRDQKLSISTSHGIGQRCSEEHVSTLEGADYTEQIGPKVLAIEGYKAQSEMVIDSLDRLITTWEDRKESVVVEGVHLSLNFVMGLMKKHPSIIPFLIYIANEEKHLERFAIRAKYMTLDPSKNKYVKYIRNIRTIQDYLCKRAEKHLVPKVNNTNVDWSVASIHSTIFSCLRRRWAGISLYDMATNTVKGINEEYCRQSGSKSISSKGMFRMIQRQGSLRRYMAIVNTDGSVAKAWPFSCIDKVGAANKSYRNESAVGLPLYGPMQVQEAEPINVQFGNFGIGSWPHDTEGTSYSSSIISYGADVDEEATKLSSKSSPLNLDGHEKEAKTLTEEAEVLESEEEQFQDEDESGDSTVEFGDEFGGSVTESSARSDEEYEDEPEGRTISDSKRTAGYRNSACFPRTLSMVPSRKPVHQGSLYSRFHSLPLRRSHSSKIKNMNALKTPSDV